MVSAESLLTSAWHALPAEEKYRRYLGALGLPTHGNSERLKQRLAREYSAAWNEFRSIARRRADGDFVDDVYSIKNRSLPFSLLVTISERGELHGKAFSAIVGFPETLSSILDVGCENGFFTCLLALQWPTAQVVGIDPSEAAIARARELAAKLNLKNVTFFVGSTDNISNSAGARQFELITTVTVLNDGKLFPSCEQLHKQTSKFFTPLVIDPAPPAFTAIAAMLAPTGRWVAIERCQKPALFSAWCQALDVVGLGLDWDSSQRIRCEEALLSIVVAGHNLPRPMDLKLAHGLWMSADFNCWSLPGEPAWAIRDQQAEAIFTQLNPKRCIDRIVGANRDGDEIQRIEVWESGSLALFYMAVHPSARTHLQLRALTDLHAMRDHWKTSAIALRKNAPMDAKIEESHAEE